LLWAQALLLLREMLMKKVELCIDIHGLLFVTNLLHQVDVWDDMVDYSIHNFTYAQVLSALTQMCIPFQRKALSGTSACERGYYWEKALALLGEMTEQWLQPTLVSLIASVCAIAPAPQSPATEALRRTFIDTGRELDCSCQLPVICGMAPCNLPPVPACVALEDATPRIHLKVPGLLAIHKPPNWEVDTQAHGPASGLSFWLRAVRSEMPRTLGHDTEHSFGFIHRLDRPSSGLLLAAEIFEACYLLQWQLIVGTLAREYVVVCLAWALPELHRMDAQVLQRCGTEGRTGEILTRGRPSQTWVTVLVYGTHGGRQWQREWPKASAKHRQLQRMHQRLRDAQPKA
jgi:hypothetical protein